MVSEPVSVCARGKKKWSEERTGDFVQMTHAKRKNEHSKNKKKTANDAFFFSACFSRKLFARPLKTARTRSLHQLHDLHGVLRFVLKMLQIKKWTNAKTHQNQEWDQFQCSLILQCHARKTHGHVQNQLKKCFPQLSVALASYLNWDST